MPTKTKPSISLHNKKVSLNFIDVDLVITKPDFANDNMADCYGQYHRRKNECGLITKGKLLIKYQNKSGKLIKRVLNKGDVFHFPPGAVHQEQAITDCEIIEASTPHFNDRVRVENKFKIKTFTGLPTTKLKDIKLL